MVEWDQPKVESVERDPKAPVGVEHRPEAVVHIFNRVAVVHAFRKPPRGVEEHGAKEGCACDELVDANTREGADERWQGSEATSE